jgi:hypothetical protein
MALVPRRLFYRNIGNGWILCSLLACADPPKPAQAPTALVEEFSPPPLLVEAEIAPAPASLAIPTRCGDENAEGVCAPPAAFVKDVCGGYAQPDVALSLFAKGSPWTRAYLRLNVEAWYTGSRSARVALKLDEEVVVMHHPPPAGGIIVNGGGERFDVIRLDGSCATLSAEEVTLKRPPAPKHPSIPWKQLDQRTRDALVSDPAVSEASTAFDEACTGAAPACNKAGGKLTAAILDYLGRGGKIPPLLVTRR